MHDTHSTDAPSHGAPPCSGNGREHERLRHDKPTPHELLHGEKGVKDDHPPLTGGPTTTSTPSALITSRPEVDCVAALTAVREMLGWCTASSVLTAASRALSRAAGSHEPSGTDAPSSARRVRTNENADDEAKPANARSLARVEEEALLLTIDEHVTFILAPPLVPASGSWSPLHSDAAAWAASQAAYAGDVVLTAAFQSLVHPMATSIDFPSVAAEAATVLRFRIEAQSADPEPIGSWIAKIGCTTVALCWATSTTANTRAHRTRIITGALAQLPLQATAESDAASAGTGIVDSSAPLLVLKTRIADVRRSKTAACTCDPAEVNRTASTACTPARGSVLVYPRIARSP